MLFKNHKNLTFFKLILGPSFYFKCILENLGKKLTFSVCRSQLIN